jgi:phenylalanyl-tRNA synthetase beta chain
MNISYNWLKEYVDFDLTPDEVAAALTSIGLETGGVEEVQTIKGGLEGIVIGEVLTCEPHPNSDHMHVTTVNLGSGDPVQIVCGASNVAAGQKVVVATIGTKLYDGDESFTIKKSKLRGIESCGMICAEDEIGIGTDHAGIIVLPQDAVPGTASWGSTMMPAWSVPMPISSSAQIMPQDSMPRSLDFLMVNDSSPS